MANKSKKSAKPSKRDLRKQAKRDLERKLAKAKQDLAEQKARAKDAAKKAKSRAKKAKAQAKKDIKKAQKNAADVQKTAIRDAKRAAKGKSTENSAPVHAAPTPRSAATRRPTSARTDGGQSVASLRAKAKAQGVVGYSRLTKDQLRAKVK